VATETASDKKKEEEKNEDSPYPRISEKTALRIPRLF